MTRRSGVKVLLSKVTGGTARSRRVGRFGGARNGWNLWMLVNCLLLCRILFDEFWIGRQQEIVQDNSYDLNMGMEIDFGQSGLMQQGRSWFGDGGCFKHGYGNYDFQVTGIIRRSPELGLCSAPSRIGRFQWVHQNQALTSTLLAELWSFNLQLNNPRRRDTTHECPDTNHYRTAP